MRKTKAKIMTEKRENAMVKKEKAITLIALMITIIVLLILAGVSIAILTGENGILTRANDAKEKTEQATAEEKVQAEVAGSFGTDGKIDLDILNKNLENVEGLTLGLPINYLPTKVVVDGYEIAIGYNGSVGTVVRIVEYQTEYTKPYLPSSQFKQVDGTNLDNGLVITDGTNYWTWAEVPTSIYINTTYNNGIAPAGADDYDSIEAVLNNYVGTLLSRGTYKDEWYAECGIESEEEYNNLKNYMLSSIYSNGGFWVGQYEAGANTYPATADNDTREIILQEGAYPYNFITCANAQIQSSKINAGNYTSSLMFGIQWDLILKHLETNGIEKGELITDSSDWGNYRNVAFNINRGGYSSNPFKANGFVILSENETYSKPENGSVAIILTPGATDRNMKMNIYDIAGNLYEWTLEKTSSEYGPCVSRGGYCFGYGYDLPASVRNDSGASFNSYHTRISPSIILSFFM